MHDATVDWSAKRRISSFNKPPNRPHWKASHFPIWKSACCKSVLKGSGFGTKRYADCKRGVSLIVLAAIIVAIAA